MKRFFFLLALSVFMLLILTSCLPLPEKIKESGNNENYGNNTPLPSSGFPSWLDGIWRRAREEEAGEMDAALHFTPESVWMRKEGKDIRLGGAHLGEEGIVLSHEGAIEINSSSCVWSNELFVGDYAMFERHEDLVLCYPPKSTTMGEMWLFHKN